MCANCRDKVGPLEDNAGCELNMHLFSVDTSSIPVSRDQREKGWGSCCV